MTDEHKLFKAIHSNQKEKVEEVFILIYDKYKSLLLFIAAKYLQDPDDIQDVVQETFIEFFKNIKSIHTSIKGYLSIACKHRSLNFLKKQKQCLVVDMQELDRYDEKVDDFKLQEFANDRLHEIIIDMQNILHEDEVNIILLHLVENYKFDEIALKYNESVNTIKTKYYRALKKYRKEKGR